MIDGETWYALKRLAERSTGWPMDTLHVMGGVVLQLAVAALLRRPIKQWTPWLIVLVLELSNEAYDLWFERWPSLTHQLGEGARDVLGTMALPTLLMIVARRWPRLLTSGR